jgi:hypothetical protein
MQKDNPGFLVTGIALLLVSFIVSIYGAAAAFGAVTMLRIMGVPV